MTDLVVFLKVSIVKEQLWALLALELQIQDMFSPHVHQEMGLGFGTLLTNWTWKLPFHRMHSLVSPEVAIISKGLGTLAALERPLSSVLVIVTSQGLLGDEALVAVLAIIDLFARMAPSMKLKICLVCE